MFYSERILSDRLNFTEFFANFGTINRMNNVDDDDDILFICAAFINGFLENNMRRI